MSIENEYEEALDNLIAAAEHARRHLDKPTRAAALLDVEKAKKALDEIADRL